MAGRHQWLLPLTCFCKEEDFGLIFVFFSSVLLLNRMKNEYSQCHAMNIYEWKKKELRVVTQQFCSNKTW